MAARIERGLSRAGALEAPRPRLRRPARGDGVSVGVRRVGAPAPAYSESRGAGRGLSRAAPRGGPGHRERPSSGLSLRAGTARGVREPSLPRVPDPVRHGVAAAAPVWRGPAGGVQALSAVLALQRE